MYQNYQRKVIIPSFFVSNCNNFGFIKLKYDDLEIEVTHICFKSILDKNSFAFQWKFWPVWIWNIRGTFCVTLWPYFSSTTANRIILMSFQMQFNNNLSYYQKWYLYLENIIDFLCTRKWADLIFPLAKEKFSVMIAEKHRIVPGIIVLVEKKRVQVSPFIPFSVPQV